MKYRLIACAAVLMLLPAPAWADCASEIAEVEAEMLLAFDIDPEVLEEVSFLLDLAILDCIDADPLAEGRTPALSLLAEARALLGLAP